jgi:trk system potassium uptake protein TrkA
MDEVNLMASLLAKRVGCSRTAVHGAARDYVPIYKQLGIDIVLSPRTGGRATTSCALARRRCCTASRVLEDGQAEVVELTVSSHSPAVGRELTKMR